MDAHTEHAALIEEATEKAQDLRRSHTAIPFSLGMVLVTLGVVYGDIGTSPMYVMKAIVSGGGGLSMVNQELVLGALSLVIWTLTLVTTVKYVLVAMRADNGGEGGIFALYSLVRRYSKWLILPAMLGGAALLADGILTPAVTVTTAIEGLRTIDIGARLIGPNQGKVVLITIAIISLLFVAQRAGTSNIGRAFGPVMTLWFGFLGIAGISLLITNPGVLRALNPWYGVQFLLSPYNRAGLMVLGSVFLATTGAEALYSDMGHVGAKNIYASWPFVKACLILNYLGQGAWLLANADNIELQAIPDLNPFFEMLPEGFRPFAVILSTLAAIIASQALITGSFTIVSEAARLNLMPHLQINYPSDTKGQLYIPLVNTIMWIGCVFVVLLFQSSAHMEAAYGLAITLTMLMTSILLCVYLSKIMKRTAYALIFIVFFGFIEIMFFGSSLTKFLHGGYITLLMTLVLLCVMLVWRRGTAIERTQTVLLPIKEYIPQLGRLRDDASYPLIADNLVFLLNRACHGSIDRDVLYSILDKYPKRARAYWFLNVMVTDEPHTRLYYVDSIGTDFVFNVTLKLGFKENQRINAYLRQIVGDLMASGELPPQNHEYSVYHEPSHVGDFKFCMLRKALTPESDLLHIDHAVMTAKYVIRRICGSPSQWFGLENSATFFEYVPLFVKRRPSAHLERVGATLPSNLQTEPVTLAAEDTTLQTIQLVDEEEAESDEPLEDLFSEGLPAVEHEDLPHTDDAERESEQATAGEHVDN
ncbi:KUP/HAK/KT family potassium transporter [Collinsella sp. zg1085]|uniref:KUP/HAK/KT family potassium transporter n=1 Tax=Collinsella sp. zg1085 TaxID=2844380 RepID=UPI001C0B41B0|nr:KUP/HAK/KT family potassium transporter [Collinsella sp. zg1085]QWT17222.1 KUP/HAK/KT family potassium transporter [Collinsella sp. zg1085]